MKAKLLPLRGKYYGTEVSIEEDDSEDFSSGIIQIWVMGNFKPSRRELEGYEEEEEYEICDNHYETETSLELAEKLVEAVNGKT